MYTGGELEAKGSIAGIGRPHTHSTLFGIGFNLNTTEYQQDGDNTFSLNDNLYFQQAVAPFSCHECSIKSLLKLYWESTFSSSPVPITNISNIKSLLKCTNGSF